MKACAQASTRVKFLTHGQPYLKISEQSVGLVYHRDRGRLLTVGRG